MGRVAALCRGASGGPGAASHPERARDDLPGLSQPSSHTHTMRSADLSRVLTNASHANGPTKGDLVHECLLSYYIHGRIVAQMVSSLQKP